MSDRWGEPITGKKTVKKGETLTEISKILDLPVDSLVSFNNLSNPNDIKVGQELLYRKEPGFWDNTFRWAFESSNEARDSREINNQINRNILNKNTPPKEELSFNLFLEDLKEAENPDMLGYKNGIWTPFKTANGDIDIGYGIDLSKQSKDFVSKVTSKGLTDNELKNDLFGRFNQYTTWMKQLFKNNGIDISKVPIKYQRGVIDMLHHLGYNGMSEFKKFFKGIRDNDVDTIRREAKTYFENSSGKKQLDERRYKIRLNKYFTSNNTTKKQKGGVLDTIPNYNISEIKVDPSIFTSWNAIKLPEIKIKNEEDGSGLSDYLLKDFNSFFYTPPVKVKSKEEENNVNDEGEIDKVKNNQSEQQFTSENRVKSSNTYYYNNKEKWISDLTEAYKKAGITNPEALKYLLAQDALESGWGKSSQGSYNFGNLTTGSSWKGDYVQGKDKDANGNPILQKFRSYNSIDEYALDKVNFLTRLYDFNQNDNFQTFVSKLTGNNKGKRRYAEARNYGESLTKVFQSLINKHQEGGILLNNPETSEMLTYIKDGKFITVPNPGAGFVSGTDPVGQVVVEGAVLNKPLSWAFGKAVNWAKNLLKNKRAGTFGENIKVSNIDNSESIINKEDLPSYANPNWKGDAVELTKDRLRNGGFDRLNNNIKEESNLYLIDIENYIPGKSKQIPNISIVNYNDPQVQNKILNALPSNPTSHELGLKPSNWGGAIPTGFKLNKKFGVFSDAPEFIKKKDKQKVI